MAVYIDEGAGAYRYFNFTVDGTTSIVLRDSFPAGTIVRGVAQEIGGDVQTAVDQTQANAQLSEDWAIKTSDTVDGVEYSSKYHAGHASFSASAAAASEQNAATSESDAATSASNALGSENAAALSESNAATSEQNAAQSESNAATSEQNAAQSESNALGYSNTAQAAATDAQVARDAAFVNADVYDDVAAGIAGTSDGEQFQVVEGAEVVRYRYESGSAVEVARYPTPAGVIGTRRVAPGNGFPDPDFNNLSAWSGAPVERREVNGRAPQKHYIIAEENSADFDLYSPTWPVIHGQEYRYFTRYGNIFSGGSGEPINVTIHVEYFSDPQAENLLESRELNSVVSLHAEDRLAYDVAPIGSSCARFRFEKVGSGGTNLIVSTLDVREAINATLMGGRAHEGIGSAGRVPSPTTDELASFSTSLAGGPLENRPPLLEPNIHMALTGPALQFSGAVTVARRIMVDLGPDEAQRTLRADFLFSRRGPAAGGIPIDCEIGVAWYDNEGATLGESLFVQLEQIPFTMSHHSFTFGRHAGAELKSPEGAFLAIPFIRFTTDEENAQPLVRAIDVHLEAPPLAETSGRVPVPAAHELIALTNSLAGGPMSARPSLVRSEILF